MQTLRTTGTISQTTRAATQSPLPEQEPVDADRTHRCCSRGRGGADLRWHGDRLGIYRSEPMAVLALNPDSPLGLRPSAPDRGLRCQSCIASDPTARRSARRLPVPKTKCFWRR